MFFNEKEITTFVIISNNGLEGHELHIYVSRAVGVLIVRVCGKEGKISGLQKVISTHTPTLHDYQGWDQFHSIQSIHVKSRNQFIQVG